MVEAKAFVGLGFSSGDILAFGGRAAPPPPTGGATPAGRVLAERLILSSNMLWSFSFNWQIYTEEEAIPITALFQLLILLQCVIV